jgi:5-methylcytosine-specific restriction enzyme subunit McrC
MSKSIQVFEYQHLSVGEKGFGQEHFEALAQYKTDTRCKYFELLHHKIRFLNYVGVIKVADLTIEILPKIDRANSEKPDKKLWQRVLVEMLRNALGLAADITTYADIEVQQVGVLDAYLQYFLSEVATLSRQGLLKQYRRAQENTTALKGKFLIHQQLSRNTVHKERFFVEHTIYDRDNKYNQLLFKALEVVQIISRQSDLGNTCAALLLDFPTCAPIKADEKVFARLTYDRKTQRYRRAIDLARIILLNYQPDISGGSNNILAIMFDMNKLWEKYIENQLSQLPNCQVKSQETTEFWTNSHTRKKAYLKPDFILEIGAEKYIIDTKWKHKNEVAPDDLRQMYAYSHYFGAKKTFLLYPFCAENNEGKIKLEKGQFADSDIFCGRLFVDLLDKDKKLNLGIGEEIAKLLHIEKL